MSSPTASSLPPGFPFLRAPTRTDSQVQPSSLNPGPLDSQLLVVASLGLKEHRKAADETWKHVLESRPENPGMISDLNRAVRELELSIPAGTRARQYNVRLVDKKMLLKVRKALERRNSLIERTESVKNILGDRPGLEIMDIVIGQAKAVQILEQVVLEKVDFTLNR